MTEWLRLQAAVAKDQAVPLSAAMEASGALAVTLENAGEEDYYDIALPGEPMWKRQRVTGLFPGEMDAEGLHTALSDAFSELVITIDRLPDRDWERSWLDSFRPIKVGQRLWVCPSWLEPVRDEEINLRIDPGLAFGTGTHATTGLCLDYLSTAPLDGVEVIDFGCGSGILAIAALKLGARRAVGIDIDERALAASVENARRNAVLDRFTTADADSVEPAGLVIANILATTLLQLQPQLCGLVNPGGRLLLSGILAGQAEEVESRFRSSFRFQHYRRQDWMLLVGTKLHSSRTGFHDV